MKFRLLTLTIIVLSLVLTACGGGGGGDDPSKPVKDFFDAFAKQDADKAANAICKQYREDVKAGMEMIFGFLAMAGEDAKIEIVDLKMKVEDETDNEAYVVATSGTMKMTLAGEVQEEPLGDPSERLKVIKEDGKWVICDDAFVADMGGF